MQTSDVRGAGTDSDVSIIVFGNQGDTGTRPLESSANDFERGNLDTFFFTVSSVAGMNVTCCSICQLCCAWWRCGRLFRVRA